ncbi:hypothetical protein GCM10009838_75510 [Catenulispora subtropica]|uniref:FAD-dependent oxidoreductase 2 FAD-binding domain-containing protein n=1 Tax=Catenulispora subtropica TaxID=450798 RepID=A0ABP5EHZ4_9ACTN
MSAHHAIVVLGAGPGGHTAAIRAAQPGLPTAIVEAEYWASRLMGPKGTVHGLVGQRGASR